MFHTTRFFTYNHADADALRRTGTVARLLVAPAAAATPEAAEEHMFRELDETVPSQALLTHRQLPLDYQHVPGLDLDTNHRALVVVYHPPAETTAWVLAFRNNDPHGHAIVEVEIDVPGHPTATATEGCAMLVPMGRTVAVILDLGAGRTSLDNGVKFLVKWRRVTPTWTAGWEAENAELVWDTASGEVLMDSRFTVAVLDDAAVAAVFGGLPAMAQE